jgi:hypothetical protein
LTALQPFIFRNRFVEQCLPEDDQRQSAGKRQTHLLALRKIQRRLPVLPRHRTVDQNVLDVALRRVEERVEQERLHDAAEPARARLLDQGALGNLAQARRGEAALDPAQRKEAFVLRDKGVLGLGQDAEEVVFGQSLQGGEDGQAANELGDKAVGDEGEAREKKVDFVFSCAKRLVRS